MFKQLHIFIFLYLTEGSALQGPIQPAYNGKIFSMKIFVKMIDLM